MQKKNICIKIKDEKDFTMLTESGQERLDRILDILTRCNSILFITGAGVSAESGIPTYRGIGGLYEGQDTDEGIPIEEALSGTMLKSNPRVTWKYLMQIENALKGKTFNRAHQIIAEIEKMYKRVWILTQNIDGFHTAAGSRNVIDIHGDRRELYCMNRYCSYRIHVAAYSAEFFPPICPQCGEYLRPDVVLFGEFLSITKTRLLMEELDRGFDIVFSIGTSSLFPYIMDPVFKAEQKGIPTVEINPGETSISTIADFNIRSSASEALEYLMQNLRKSR